MLRLSNNNIKLIQIISIWVFLNREESFRFIVGEEFVLAIQIDEFSTNERLRVFYVLYSVVQKDGTSPFGGIIAASELTD